MSPGSAAKVWDDVVVGAGSAGSALAARLADDPHRRVLLIEAGGGSVAAHPAAAPLGRPVLSGANWAHEARVVDGGDRIVPYPVGRGLGGSSAVNGAIALRGLERDFRGWAESGNHDWSWDRVLPSFIQLESDADVKNDLHGQDGPVPIRRPGRDELGKPALAFLRAADQCGLELLADLNGSGHTGVGLVPSHVRDGRRVATASAYLDDAPNLTIWDHARATRVRFAGNRAVGLDIVHHGEHRAIAADRVTLAAGAIATPLILLRSGVGPADRTASLGIAPVVDLAGVGRNLTDHPAVPIWCVASPDACRPDEGWHQVMARTGPRADLTLLLVGNVRDAPVPGISRVLGGRTGVAFNTVLGGPLSRGSVTLADPRPDAPPRIDLRLTSAPDDVTSLAAGVRTAWTLLRAGPFDGLLDRVLLWTDRIVDDDAKLHRTIRNVVSPMWHPSGTAKMGPDDDPDAVVDQRFQVRGTTGLRVVDASVLPSITSVPPGLTCVMLAERAAAWMR